MCMPKLVICHGVGQQGNRNLLNLYAIITKNLSRHHVGKQVNRRFRMCMPKLVICHGVGQQGNMQLFNVYAKITKKLSRHRVGQQVNRLFSNVHAKIGNLSWCRSTGQQAAF